MKQRIYTPEEVKRLNLIRDIARKLKLKRLKQMREKWEGKL